jgi:hypothetical protein
VREECRSLIEPTNATNQTEISAMDVSNFKQYFRNNRESRTMEDRKNNSINMI